MALDMIGCYGTKFIGLILALAGLGFLIGFHELGHWLFANLFGIHTPTFSIGMGPQLWSKKIGKTNFSLSLIPLGGYVEIAGLAEVGQGEQEHAFDRSARSFFVKPYWQKLLVLSGGILFNLIAAYVILTALFMTGMPKSSLLTPQEVPTILREVKEGQPAAIAGLQPEDRIIALNETPITNALQLTQALGQHKDGQVTLTVERHHTQHKIAVLTTTQGTIGVIFTQPAGHQKPLGFIEASQAAIAMISGVMTRLGALLGGMFKSRSVDGLGGPLMIIAQMMQSVSEGFPLFLALLAFISINLAALNLIPLPILDGGQIVLTTIESLAGRPIAGNARLIIHYACWILALALFAFLTYSDIKVLFGNFIGRLFAGL